MKRILLLLIIFLFAAVGYSYPADTILSETDDIPQKPQSQADPLSRWQNASDAELANFVNSQIKIFIKELTKTAEGDTFINFNKIQRMTDQDRVSRLSGIFSFIAKKLESGGYEIKDKDFDYSSVIPQGTQIIFAGEFHEQYAEREVSVLAEQLRGKIGIGHVALESLTDNLENGIKKFNETGDLKYISFCRDGDTELDKRSFPVAKAARGLNIIALEDIRAQFGGIKADRQLREDRLFRKVLELEEPLQEFISGPTGVAARNITWIKKLSPYLEAYKTGRNEKPMLVYGGSRHFGYGESTGSLADRTKAQGIKVVNILYISAASIYGNNFWNNIPGSGKYAQPKIIINVPKAVKDTIGADYIILF
ncbi:MAG: hypothetical protein FWF35_03855 [Elusimicrobia bacterium]|nr:hypothetical protein [Elusimicrobiota bacterium]